MKIFHIGLCVNPNGYSSFPHAFKEVLGEENYRELPTGDKDLNNKAMAILKEFKPDILFMQIQAENIISPYVCEHARQMGVFVINWTGDKRHVVPQWMIDIAPLVNLTAFSNMEDVYKMRELGFKSEFLEIGYDPTIYKPEGESVNVSEIVFFGNNYGANHFPMSKFRIKMVEFLQKEYGNRFGVYGSGWQNGNGNINHSQYEEAKHYRGAKIAINCSHFDCDTYNSDRLLRILGTGVMCLSYNHVNMRNTFIPSGDLEYFSNFSELKEWIDYYLEHEDQRLDIAEQGNTFVKDNFTFKHQVENIIKLAK